MSSQTRTMTPAVRTGGPPILCAFSRGGSFRRRDSPSYQRLIQVLVGGTARSDGRPGRTTLTRAGTLSAERGEESSMDSEVVGATGVIVVATRGATGAGEVMVRLRGGSETFLARSEEPIAKGTSVLVIAQLGGRTVSVIPLTAHS